MAATCSNCVSLRKSLLSGEVKEHRSRMFRVSRTSTQLRTTAHLRKSGTILSQHKPLNRSVQCSAATYRNPPKEPCVYDMNFWHYQPWWWQPHMIVIAGLAIVMGVTFLSEDHMSAAMWAGVPVLLWWHIFLRVLPGQFRRFAVRYMETHDVDEL